MTANYFSIFDGHGGETIANYLKDNLHKQIIKSKLFYDNPIEAIYKAFRKIEAKILKDNSKDVTTKPEKSGSCALLALFISKLVII